jgi:hypothetical protein
MLRLPPELRSEALNTDLSRIRVFGSEACVGGVDVGSGRALDGRSALCFLLRHVLTNGVSVWGCRAPPPPVRGSGVVVVVVEEERR